MPEIVHINIDDYARRCVDLYEGLNENVGSPADFARGYYYATLAHLGGHYQTAQGNREFPFTLDQFISKIEVA